MNKVVALQPERPADLSASQLSLVKRTVAKDCNDSEFDLFINVCRRVGLDPFRRQIHAVIYNAGNEKKRTMTLITAIDGFRSIAARSNNYRPDEDEPEIVIEEDLKDKNKNPKGISKAVVRSWKLAKDGKWHKISGVAYWEEFAPLIEGYDEMDNGETWPDGNPKKTRVPNGKDMLDPKNSFWRKMPHLMIAKCAEAQALRKGWPEDLSGLYSPEEMHQADTRLASEELEEVEQQQRLERAGTENAIYIQWKGADSVVAVNSGEFVDKAMEFIDGSESSIELTNWKERNRHALQNFWAHHKSDALELNTYIAKKVELLDKLE